MTEPTIEKVDGGGEVVNATSGEIEGAPAAHTSGDIPSLTHIKWSWLKDPRPKSSDGVPQPHDPYWQISIYTDAEIAAIREADKLDPDLAEHYKDLLED
jgi:hypothetical protein